MTRRRDPRAVMRLQKSSPSGVPEVPAGAWQEGLGRGWRGDGEGMGVCIEDDPVGYSGGEQAARAQ